MREDSSVVNHQACLKWSGGTLPLGGACIIGRRSDNDLSLNDPKVSRRHALLMHFNDEWWLNDLGSRNGVRVNSLPLTSARRLRDGDEIRIAGHRLLFHNSASGTGQRSTLVGRTTQVAPADNDGELPGVVCELIIVSEDGAILEGEKAARWFFGNSLSRAPGADHCKLPPPVCQWLARAGRGGASNDAFELVDGGRRITIALASGKEGRLFLLLREEFLQATIERLQTLGLTEREAEVMHWVCEGKKNPEIAVILKVSTHTVNRHLEHILNKLGVDNRQKAVVIVRERLGA